MLFWELWYCNQKSLQQSKKRQLHNNEFQTMKFINNLRHNLRKVKSWWELESELQGRWKRSNHHFIACFHMQDDGHKGVRVMASYARTGTEWLHINLSIVTQNKCPPNGGRGRGGCEGGWANNRKRYTGIDDEPYNVYWMVKLKLHCSITLFDILGQ